jgi:hypothetical protein
MIEALRAAGGNPLYSELKGVGHNSWTPAYRESECLDWMFSQRASQKLQANQDEKSSIDREDHRARP